MSEHRPLSVFTEFVVELLFMTFHTVQIYKLAHNPKITCPDRKWELLAADFSSHELRASIDRMDRYPLGCIGLHLRTEDDTAYSHAEGSDEPPIDGKHTAHSTYLPSAAMLIASPLE